MTKLTNTAEMNINLIKLIRTAECNNDKTLVNLYTSKLIACNTGFIGQLIKRSGIRGNIEVVDLMQSGTLGLIEASTKYNLDSGMAFTTFAHNWVKGAITREGYRMGAAVQLSYNAAEKRVTISRIMAKFKYDYNKDMPIEMVANEVDMPIGTVRAIIETFSDGVSLDGDSGDGEGSSIHEVISDDSHDSFGLLELDEFILDVVIDEMDELSAFLFQTEIGINGFSKMSIREAFKKFPEKMVKILKTGETKKIGLSTVALKSKVARDFFISRYKELCGIEA